MLEVPRDTLYLIDKVVRQKLKEETFNDALTNAVISAEESSSYFRSPEAMTSNIEFTSPPPRSRELADYEMESSTGPKIMRRSPEDKTPGLAASDL